MKPLTGIKNYFFPSQPLTPAVGNFGDKRGDVSKNLSHYISPVQLSRIRQDVGTWRDALRESEQAYYPQRVRMQRLFIDTVLNGHVISCMERRDDLTLLRDFKLAADIDSDEDENATKLLRTPWFYTFVGCCLDAQKYGYSLIALDDLINDAFPKLHIIKRWNVSPDRFNVTSFVYSLSGIDFREEPQRKWHVYVSTPNRDGASNCGYGYLYPVALYEIILRNVLGNNADFTDLYAQPYRVGRTTKTTETERGELEAAIRNMGSAGWALLDEGDDITFLETKLGGTGWQGYENLEKRCEAKISKIILGHADAMDSTPGKLGAGQDGEESPVAKALAAKQSKDGMFVENLVNTELLPRMREMGVNIPEGLTFFYKNDEEKEAMRVREDASNKATAEIAQIMKNAGLKMSAEYFKTRTGIECEEVEEQVDPVAGMDKGKQLTQRVKNRLKELYNL